MELTEEQFNNLNKKLQKAQKLLLEVSELLNVNQPDEKQEVKPNLIKPSIQIKRIIDFWNGCGMTRHPNLENKTGQSLIKRLKKILETGKFFNALDDFKIYHNRKFTTEEVLETIRRFTLIATNSDYEPPDGGYKEHLKSFNLFSFLYNPRATNKKSLFIECFENEPVLIAQQLEVEENQTPRLTLEIKKMFIKTVLGGITPIFSQKQENQFIIASNRLKEFYLKNQNKLNGMAFSGIGGSTENVLADMLINSVVKSVGEGNTTQITPGYLCSDLTFSQRFPAYLNNQGIVMRR